MVATRSIHRKSWPPSAHLRDAERTEWGRDDKKSHAGLNEVSYSAAAPRRSMAPRAAGVSAAPQSCRASTQPGAQSQGGRGIGGSVSVQIGHRCVDDAGPRRAAGPRLRAPPLFTTDFSCGAPFRQDASTVQASMAKGAGAAPATCCSESGSKNVGSLAVLDAVDQGRCDDQRVRIAPKIGSFTAARGASAAEGSVTSVRDLIETASPTATSARQSARTGRTCRRARLIAKKDLGSSASAPVNACCRRGPPG